MGKKVALGIFGGIAILGLALMILGFAMGGHLGGLTLRGNQVVYYTQDDTISVMRLPSWMGPRYLPDMPSSNVGNLQSGGQLDAPFTDAPKAVVVDISAGYLKVQNGDDFGLTVDGPLEYASEYKDGTWHITSLFDDISENGSNGRFWRAGADITTTFTLTLPREFGSLDVSIGMGEATIKGFTLDTLNCSVGMGEADIADCTAQTLQLKAGMGEIDTQNIHATNATLECGMGSIGLSGTVTGRLSASCSFGNIRARLARPADYGWESNVSFGSIKVDGSNLGAGFGSHSGGNASAATFYSLRCIFGDISLIFT